MSRLDPPKVLLDRSFMAAVVDDTHPAHADCIELYRDLVDRFEREEVLLVAVSTHLRDIERGGTPTTAQKVGFFLHRNHRGVFAPVDPLYVGGQHRRATKRFAAADPTGVIDPADALTLVMCERHDIRRIAAATDDFDGYRIERATLVAE